MRDLLLQKLYRRNYYIKHRKEEIRYMKNYYKKQPERLVWDNMKKRCYNKNSPKYFLYGGRGIQILYKSYNEFIKDVGFRPSKEYSIDRINNNGHYEEGNCRWALQKIQQNNRRKSNQYIKLKEIIQ